GGGMHCRSNKSPTWGTGAGARLADLRAFAGAVALVVFALLSPASAVDNAIVWKEVGSFGNAPNPNTGLGRVTYDYKISAYDTTISQYVDFLNGSDAGKKGQYGVYSSSIGTTPSNSTPAITQGGSAGSYTYSLSNSSFANQPVNLVNWFSAARFVNWYANDKSAAATATETGSYTLINGQTTGSIVARNANAKIFLPSADEWTKAAFYNATAQNYYLWPTTSNTKPTAAEPTGTELVTTPNTANFKIADAAADTLKLTNVGTYVNTTSTYGLFDMLGNVTQMSDTTGTGANAGLFQAFGGSYASTSTQMDQFWSSDPTSGAQFRNGGSATATTGFRVAAISVPEPGNMVAAAMGIGGLFGFQIMKRRKLALARAAG
ncbi:MAG: SUMF1/EgtB/PvdO family nonheme iron enzyme, partial [Planctomycetia bacterium]